MTTLPSQGSTHTTAAPIGFRHYRWIICGLLFFGVTNNYMDRQIIGVLKTTLQAEFGWNEIDYSNLVFAFQTAYAAGMLLMGRLIDRVGSRIGYALAVCIWSAAAMATALAAAFSQWVMARATLGLGEAGVFPASIKTVAEWFPKKERALATGIFNAGTNIGAILTPLVVPWIAYHWGWRWAFVSVGATGVLVVLAWLLLYRKPEEHPRVSAWELSHIKSDPPESMERVPWLRLLPHRETWAFAAGKFCIDPIWWFYLFWIPDFFNRNHGLNLLQIGPPLVAIYLISDVGSVAGGWFSSSLIKRGVSINVARKAAMLLCAAAVVPIVGAYYTQSKWTAALLIGLAAAAHQGFSANLFTLTSDMFPSRAVGSVTGFGGMAGAVGGMFIAKVVGYLLERTGSYFVPFLIAASAYFLAVALIHALSPRLQPAKLA
jgi:ACS family hexuronate transporter-like MFS transporter